LTLATNDIDEQECVRRVQNDLENGIDNYKNSAIVGVALASWFQIMTIAMHRASPTMITPVR